MINLGIIGYNKGNGHPISFSSIINGYDENNLKKYCDYPAIIKYLIKNKNKKHIKYFNVTKIFSNNKIISKKISKISKIDKVVNNINQLNDCDLILLLRDDLRENDKILKILLRKNKKIFVDKQISNSMKFINSIKKKKLILLSGSAVPFSNEIKKFKKKFKNKQIEWIKSYCPNTWLRYGRHLLDPIMLIKRSGVKNFKITQKKSYQDVIILEFNDNSYAKMVFKKNVNFNLKISIKLKNINKVETLIIKDHFSMFKNMLKKLEKLYLTSKNNNNIRLSKLFLDITKKYELF